MRGIETVRTALLASAPLVALVAQRVRADIAGDRDAAPYVVVRRKAVEREFALNDALLAKRELFEIECWADERLSTVDMEEAVVAALLAAGLVPEDNDPDAIDPALDVRCAIVMVSVWTTPELG